MSWTRSLDTTLAAWLAAGSWMLPAGPEGPGFRVLLCAFGLAAAAASAASLKPGARRWHVMNLALGSAAAALAVRGWPAVPSPLLQNGLATGLLLALSGCLPTRPSDPPEPWRRRFEPSSALSRSGDPEHRGTD